MLETEGTAKGNKANDELGITLKIVKATKRAKRGTLGWQLVSRKWHQNLGSYNLNTGSGQSTPALLIVKIGYASQMP